MVLIFSVQGDLSTSDVIEWILYFKECCFRINNVNELNSLLELYPFLSVPETKKKFTSVWYRNSPNVFLPATIMDNKITDKDIREYVYSEQHGLFEAVYSALEENRWLGHWTNSSPGKFKQLFCETYNRYKERSICMIAKDSTFKNRKGYIKMLDYFITNDFAIRAEHL